MFNYNFSRGGSDYPICTNFFKIALFSGSQDQDPMEGCTPITLLMTVNQFYWPTGEKSRSRERAGSVILDITDLRSLNTLGRGPKNRANKC